MESLLLSLLPRKTVEVTAVVVPRVTCDLPVHPISFDSRWNHLSDVKLADPDFGRPGKIDILLGVEVFVDVLLHGRRIGPPNLIHQSPSRPSLAGC